MPDAALAPDKGAISDVLEKAAERGYLLVSELEPLRDPTTNREEFLESAITVARDRGIDVIDDLAGDEEPEGEIAMTSSRDAVRQYLDAAGRHDLLDKEQEADLSKRYDAGMVARRLLDEEADSLSPTQTAKLRRIKRDGGRAKEKMVRSNLRLVVSRAKRWLGRGVDMIELIQEGNLGLIRAVEKFDHKKGYKFSTYAVWWIRQSLQRGVAKRARTIRVPAHVWELSAKLRRAEIDLRQQFGRDPKEKELADAVDITVERLREVREALQRSSSLDKPVGEDGDATLGDLIADVEATDPQSEASVSDAQKRIEAVLGDLDEREREILKLRFGFVDGERHTLADIAERFDLSRERVRQVEKQALAKLRHPSSTDDLDVLLEAIAAA